MTDMHEIRKKTKCTSACYVIYHDSLTIRKKVIHEFNRLPYHFQFHKHHCKHLLLT